MARKNLNTVKLAVFVIVAFVLFTYGLYRVGDQQSLLSNHLTVYVDFEDVKGLRPGNNVRYSGITVGSVEDITILNDTTLRVRLALENKAEQYIRKNAQAEIGSSGLVGNMLVNIRPGPGRAAAITEGDILPTRRNIEMNEMLSVLSASNQRIDQITAQLLEITEKMNQGQGSIAKMLNDEQMANHLGQSMQQMAATSRSVRAAAQHLAQLMAQVNAGEGNLGYLVRDTSLKGQMSQLSNQLDTLVGLRAVSVLDSLEVLSAALSKASRSVQTLVEDLDEGEGLVATLLTDSTFTYDLQATLQNLEQGTQKFDQNMKALQYSWPFRKYFRKEAKKEKQ